MNDTGATGPTGPSEVEVEVPTSTQKMIEDLMAEIAQMKKVMEEVKTVVADVKVAMDEAKKFQEEVEAVTSGCCSLFSRKK